MRQEIRTVPSSGYGRRVLFPSDPVTLILPQLEWGNSATRDLVPILIVGSIRDLMETPIKKSKEFPIPYKCRSIEITG